MGSAVPLPQRVWVLTPERSKPGAAQLAIPCRQALTMPKSRAVYIVDKRPDVLASSCRLHPLGPRPSSHNCHLLSL